MIPYLGVFVFSLICLYLTEKSYNKILKRFLFLVAILMPAALAGLRDPLIGTDTSGYPLYTYDFVSRASSLYQAITWNDSVEGAYSFIGYVSSHILNVFNFFLFVVSLITMIGVLWGGVASKEDKVWLFFLFFFMYYNTSLNAQRQAMALAMCLPCIAYTSRKKYVLAALAFVLAYCLHHSAILFASAIALYYFIERMPKTFNKTITKLLLIIAIVGILASFNAILTSLVGFGLEDKYVERYGSSDEYGSNVPISLFALNLFNFIVYKFITRKSTKDTLYIFGDYTMIIGVLLCFAGLISTFAVRIDAYFMFINILILTHYLPKATMFWKASTVGFYIFYWLMVVVVANLGDTYPYTSIILGQFI